MAIFSFKQCTLVIPVITNKDRGSQLQKLPLEVSDIFSWGQDDQMHYNMDSCTAWQMRDLA